MWHVSGHPRPVPAIAGVSGGPVSIGHHRMLTRFLRPQGISIEMGERRRLSDAEAAHLDTLLDDALRETFPASDPIAICIDSPLEGIAPDNLQDLDNAPMPPPTTLKGTEPKATLMSYYDANLWGINQIFDWWLLLVGGRGGK
jgi:hypothetical protein